MKLLLQDTGTIILFSERKAGAYPKSTGSQATDILLINAVIPVIFVYGRSRDSQEICERAISFLEDIGPEENSIIDEWKTAGIEADSAFISQALIQLRNCYCKKRRCLDCRIGAKLIGMGAHFKKQDELILEPDMKEGVQCTHMMRARSSQTSADDGIWSVSIFDEC